MGAPPTTPGDCIRILGVTTKYLTLLVLMVSRIAMNAKKWSKVVVVVSLLLCGTGTEATEHMVTETLIRSMYGYWKKVMGV